MPGNIWKFSDQLDDVDIAMLRKDFITVEQGKRYYNIGDKAFLRLARESGAIYKIGKAVRINRHILEAHMRNLGAIPQKGIKYNWNKYEE